MDAVCRWPGSAHDSTIFTHSTLYQRLRNHEFGPDVVILTDSAYGSDQFICKPLANAETNAEKTYQAAQIHTRNVVERTFGILKQRFRCMYNVSLLKKPRYFQDIILSCCILHNMIKEADDNAIDFTDHEIELQRNFGVAYMQSGEMRIQNFLLHNHFQ